MSSKLRPIKIVLDLDTLKENIMKAVGDSIKIKCRNSKKVVDK